MTLSGAGFGEIVNETLLGRAFATPADPATVPTNLYVLPHPHVNVPVNVPVAFTPGVKVTVKFAVSPAASSPGNMSCERSMVNTSDPAVMLAVVPISAPISSIAVHVWLCELPGMAVNEVGPENPNGQAVAVRLKVNTKHSSMKKAATLKNEVR